MAGHEPRSWNPIRNRIKTSTVYNLFLCKFNNILHAWRCTSGSFPQSCTSTGCVPRVTWRVVLVEQEPLTLPVHLMSSPVLSGVRVSRSWVFCIMLCRLLSCFLLYMMLSVFLVTDSDFHFGNPRHKAIIYKCIYYLIKISIVIVYTIYLNIKIKKTINEKQKHKQSTITKKSTNKQSKTKPTLLAVETKNKTECRFYSSSSSSYTYIFHV